MNEENELGAPPEGLADFVAQASPVQPPLPPPAAHEAPSAIDRQADLTAALEAPVPTPGLADRTAGAVAAPEPTPGLADQPKTASSSSSSSSTEKSSTGLSDEAIGRQNANIDQVAQTQASARDAAANVGTLEAQQAQRRSRELLADAAKGIEQTAAKLALNDHVQAEVDKKLKAGSEWRPDRAELFGGDNGPAFGIAAAVAAMAGAWMQARGLSGNNPYLPGILKMIDDNVADQVRRNTAVIQRLKEEKGDAKAAALALKQRLGQYAQQRLEGLALRDKSELVQAGVAKTRADMLTQDAKWESEQRKSLERTETNKVSKAFTSSNSTSTGGAGSGSKERTEPQGKAAAVQDSINNFGTKAGLIRNPRTGQWEVGEGALPPAVWESVNPFSDNAIHAAGEAAVEAYGRMQSGGVIGSEERPAFREQLGMTSLTRAQLAARLNATEVTIRARLRSEDEAAQKQRSTAPAGWK